MFKGRTAELRRLNALYSGPRFECVILYGRRRIGKTSLIREFIKDKKSIYFAAHETNSRENLRALSMAINGYGFGSEPTPETFKSYEDAFDALIGRARNERIVMVIDEYQNLAQCERNISQIITRAIDAGLCNGKLMLIISGSSLPLMEDMASGFENPFYGRRTAHIELKSFTFFEVRRFYSGFSPFDIAIIYGVTGGVPKYLELMDKNLSIEENILRNFFDPAAFLFEEPVNLLRGEVRELSQYNAVLKAIAQGCHKNSEIAARVELETSACTAYLKNLISFGLVTKKTPACERSIKKTVYKIRDNMMRFWYTFVPEYISLIHSGTIDKIWRETARRISWYMSDVFEDICLTWLTQENDAGRLPIKFTEAGCWWGFDPITRRESVIDILAHADDDNAIFASCEWTDEFVGIEKLDALIERSEMFRYRNKLLYLFTRAGFTADCAEKAGALGAHLVVFE